MNMNCGAEILNKLNFRLNKCSFDNFLQRIVDCLDEYKKKSNKIKETEHCECSFWKWN